MRLIRLPGWPVRIGAAAGAVLVLAAVVIYFQPQKLFINYRVEDAAPAATVGATPAAATSTPRVASETVLVRTNLQSLEHQSSGDVLLIQLPGGKRIVRLENLVTSNGPDLRVYLSAAPASSDWHGYDRDYVDLGALKGNLGNQNYPVPDGLNLAQYRSLVIWCRRFTVGFAVAPLAT